MRSTFKVLFYLKRNAPKKNGLVPVMCRMTINGKIAQFSCKLDVKEKSWNMELGRVSGHNVVAQEANRMLNKIRVGINQAYQKIVGRNNYVTVEKVRNAYLGLGMGELTIPTALVILIWGIFAGITNNGNQFMVSASAIEAPDFANGLFLTATNLGTTLGTAICGVFITVWGTHSSPLGAGAFLIVGMINIIIRNSLMDRNKHIGLTI